MPLRVRLTATNDLASLDYLTRCLTIGTLVLNANVKTSHATKDHIVMELTFPGAANGDRFLGWFHQMQEAPLEGSDQTFRVEAL